MNAYIVNGYRTAVTKSGRGGFKTVRPEHLAVQVIRHLLSQYPQIEPTEIDDLIVGNAMPEAEQGLNFARLISLAAFNTDQVSGMTVNRYCASGLETIAIAASKIHSGLADCIIAGGAESMTMVPMGGWRVVPDMNLATEHPDYYWGMGLTAEQVAKEFNISREDQDAFALRSHQRALAAQAEGKFDAQIVPIHVEEKYFDPTTQIIKTKSFEVSKDEGPRADTSIEALKKLKPVFAANGSVTAGNSSQTSDGAAFVMVVSEAFLKRHNLKPIARLVSYATAGVPPRIMGIGPVEAIPKALKRAGLSLSQIDLIELNEAFASQSVAIVRKLGFDENLLNVNGGAIALGHPLGCSGAKLSVQLFHELQRRNKKLGMVTMCVGTGQGAAGIFEML